ncbi:hypothetical protein [Embleya sp. AB8]|uniref:hypothetical protein n=1 Tax=Embleya sp. AB8 TaxID=3156304 RepID=UPI003C70A4B5
MRRTRRTLVALTAVATLLGAAPAASAGTPPPTAGDPGGRWEPVPTPPLDYPAGTRCDFPVHGEAIRDEVEQRVLETYPDGSPKWVAYRGPLVIRLTDTTTGAHFDADAGGSAVVESRPDGSHLWFVLGPILAGFGPNGGNVARGLYTIDGAYTVDISAAGVKTLTMLHGSIDDLCARIDHP